MLRAMGNAGLMVSFVMNNTHVRSLLESNKTFDLVILELMLCDGLLGFGHFYNAPTIVVSTVGSSYNVDKDTANSYPYAYVPSVFISLTDEMTFLERVQNTLHSIFTQIFYNLIIDASQEKALHEHFPDAPPLIELASNVSLVFLNAHYSVVETPRPYMPKMIPLGGLHVQPQTLPKELEAFLDSATDGAVLMSLGSNFVSANLPKEKKNAILKTFAKFPQKFLWKFEDDTLEAPSNVKIAKWLPQRAVLG